MIAVNQEKLQEQIDYIMDYFDFDKVREAMLTLDWKWGLGEMAEVPEIPRMRETARKLLKNAISCAEKEEVTYHAETGGFRATCVIEEGKPYLSLDFILTSWSNYE
jgi:hypothetical protein